LQRLAILITATEHLGAILVFTQRPFAVVFSVFPALELFTINRVELSSGQLQRPLLCKGRLLICNAGAPAIAKSTTSLAAMLDSGDSFLPIWQIRESGRTYIILRKGIVFSSFGDELGVTLECDHPAFEFKLRSDFRSFESRQHRLDVRKLYATLFGFHHFGES
jgi:hypothetical protein